MTLEKEKAAGVNQTTKNRKNESYIKLSRDLNNSPAWRYMSINCKKLLDFLIEEHLSKGGKKNGQLMATYDQLVAAGIPRRLIHRTICEAEFTDKSAQPLPQALGKDGQAQQPETGRA